MQQCSHRWRRIYMRVGSHKGRGTAGESDRSSLRENRVIYAETRKLHPPCRRFFLPSHSRVWGSSARRIHAAECIDESGLLRLRGPVAAPQLRALDYHPDYQTISLDLRDLFYLEGIAYDGNALWVLNAAYGKMYQMSRSNLIMEEFEEDFHSPHGLAFDGERFWVALQGREVLSWTSARGTLCTFTDLKFNSTGIAYGLGRVWVTHDNAGGISNCLLSILSSPARAVQLQCLTPSHWTRDSPSESIGMVAGSSF